MIICNWRIPLKIAIDWYLLKRISKKLIFKQKALLKDNKENQTYFTKLIADQLPSIIDKRKKEKTNDEKQKTLNEIDEYVSKVLGMKEGIENSFAQQLELLLIIRGKQESTLQKLQTRAQQLFNKRKNIETNAYKAILERNVFFCCDFENHKMIIESIERKNWKSDDKYSNNRSIVEK